MTPLCPPRSADAWRLRTNPSSSMAALTRSPVAVEIRPLPLSTSETVLTDTPRSQRNIMNGYFFGGSHADDLLPDYVTDKTFYLLFILYPAIIVA
ncbi:hypothetical protein MS6204_00076 [Escherichia coli]|nr:hypothetical protein [Escherichia coli]